MTTRSPLSDGDTDSATGAGFEGLQADIDRLLGIDAPAAEHLGLRDARGRLEETPFELLVGRAFVRAFSGWLRLESPEGRGAVCFEGGRPVDIAFVNMPAATRAAATPATVERWFFALAGFSAGSYAFEPLAADLVPHRTHVLRHPALLANEALLRRASPERQAGMTRWLGSPGNRFRLCQPVASALLGEALVPAWEAPLRGALRLFDGARSFADIVKASQQPAEHLLRAAYLLFCFGALEPAGPEPLTGDPPSERELRADGARIEALFALAEVSDYFAFLGVDAAASATEIKIAAARLGREVDEGLIHPDVAVGTVRQRAVIARVLGEARRILGDDTLRRRYREGLARTDS